MGTTTRRMRRAAGRVRRRVLGPSATNNSNLRTNELNSLIPGLAQVLPAGNKLKVAMLVGAATRVDLKDWVDAFRSQDLAVIAAPDASVDLAEMVVAGDTNAIHEQLKSLGAVHAIIDLTGDDSDAQITRWRRLLFHLRSKGVYALIGADQQEAAMIRAAVDDVTQTDPNQTQVAVELAGAIGPVSTRGNAVLVTKRGGHLLKLRDAETNRLIALREPRLRLDELTTLPPQTFTGRCRVHSHEADVEIPSLSTQVQVPELHLRRYTGPKLAFGCNTLMYSGFSALPDSFRHHLAASPTTGTGGSFYNPRLINATSEFGRVAAKNRPANRLEGEYYQIDCSYSGHFGHLMTETLSRLWGWDIAKRENPGLKALFRSRFPDREPELEIRLLTAYGIAREDIVWVDDPCWVDSISSASPMFHNQIPHYIHPQALDIYQRMGDHLYDSQAPSYERVFISRAVQTPRRTCHNATAVDEFFSDRGFEIIYPETLDLSVQASIFANAKVIAGFGGSAMFNMMFARNLQTAIVVTHEAYTARNELLFASLFDCDLHYFWSTPDVPHPVGGWSGAAFESNWTFDFERNASGLGQLLTHV